MMHIDQDFTLTEYSEEPVHLFENGQRLLVESSQRYSLLDLVTGENEELGESWGDHTTVVSSVEGFAYAARLRDGVSVYTTTIGAASFLLGATRVVWLSADGAALVEYEADAEVGVEASVVLLDPTLDTLQIWRGVTSEGVLEVGETLFVISKAEGVARIDSVDIATGEVETLTTDVHISELALDRTGSRMLFRSLDTDNRYGPFTLWAGAVP